MGNARLTFTDKNGNGRIDQSDDPEVNEVLQESHYYPFGMAMNGQWIGDPGRENRYRYNGKELEEDFGLGWYDYGARWCDAAIGRFTGVDPLASDFAAWSPFSYSFNNPVRFVDPDGRAPEDIILRLRDPQGNVVKELDYRNDGKLYDAAGNEYTGNITFFTETRDAINEARASNEGLDRMFQELENSPNTHEFTNNNPDVPDSNPESDNRASDEPGNSTITQFNPKADKLRAIRNKRRVPTSSDIAAHEGKHAYDRDRGQLRSRNPGPSGVSDAEVDGINAERLNQAGQNRPLRTTFGGKRIDPSRLADPKTYDPTKKNN